MKTAAILTRVHKWIGLLVGLQLLLWTTGGVVMSVFKIESVRSEAMIAKPLPLSADLAISTYPMRVAKAAGLDNFEALSLENFAGEPVWRIKSEEKTVLVSAISGRSMLPLTEEDTRKLALADYAGTGEIKQITRVETGPIEVRGRKDLYRINFSKPRNYTLWVDRNEGRIIAHRSTLWRVYDFFWMLHIMDYDDRKDFNNPLLIFFAFSAFLFVGTGIGLLVHRFLLRPRRRRR
ncbi:hypothetical protein MNBD_ALPHA06-962 [hydrothermal vent metagenome]|uniref:PepSY domain-containing protein n=1 Tax=hydrothermal vent metagenome TaxID=652676 RepID=A0A3B0RGB1_9ZZZZ